MDHEIPYPETLNRHLDHILHDRTTNPLHVIGRPESSRSAVILKLLLYIRYSPSNLFSVYFEEYVFNGAFSLQSYEHIDTVLNVLRLVLDDTNAALSSELADEYEFTDNELHIVKYMTDEQRSSIRKQLKSQPKIKEELFSMARTSRFYPVLSIKLLTVLSRLGVRRTSQAELRELVDLCRNEPDDYRSSVIQLLGAHLSVAGNVEGELKREIMIILCDSVDPNSWEKLRYTNTSSYSLYYFILRNLFHF